MESKTNKGFFFQVLHKTWSAKERRVLTRTSSLAPEGPQNMGESETALTN